MVVVIVVVEEVVVVGVVLVLIVVKVVVVSSVSVMVSICLMFSENGDWPRHNFVNVWRLVNTVSRSRRNIKLWLQIDNNLTADNFGYALPHLKYPWDCHQSIVEEGYGPWILPRSS